MCALCVCVFANSAIVYLLVVFFIILATIELLIIRNRYLNNYLSQLYFILLYLSLN